MTALSPDEFDGLLADIRDATRWLGHEYRWLHSAAHGPRMEEHTHVSVSSPSDPTAGIVEANAAMRRGLYRARDEVVDALAAVERASAALAVVSQDAAAGIVRTLTHPRMVTREELEASRAAKVRREQRGEGWGDG